MQGESKRSKTNINAGFCGVKTKIKRTECKAVVSPTYSLPFTTVQPKAARRIVPSPPPRAGAAAWPTQGQDDAWS
jgi:hypothetical protein